MKAKPQEWTSEQIDYLKEIASGKSYKEITMLLNEKFGTTRTDKGVGSKMKLLHLYNGIDARFQKNHDPFNKGVPMASWMTPEKMERCKSTQFKSDGTGQLRFRDKKPGDERIAKGGYIEVRLDKPKKVWNYDGRIASRCWEFKHVLIWEEYHKQKVPKGYKVIFADGNNKNFDVKNLVLVSNAQLLILNKNKLYFKDNPELTKTGVNIAKLIDVRNKRRNEHGKKHTS